MADVFISYSRKDGDFAKRLTNALKADGRDVWIDWEDIPRASDWLNQIYEGIEAADSLATIVTQHSLTSENCNYEISHALKHNKRIIPLIRQPIQGDVETYVKGSWVDKSWEQIARTNWQQIKQINWIFFDDDARFEDEFAAFTQTLQTDLEHVKQHTRLLVRAREWETGGQAVGFLLAGEDLIQAEDWQSAADADNRPPALTDLHRRYLAESRRTEDARQRRLRTLRRLSLVASVIGVAAILATVVAVIGARSATITAATAQVQATTAAQQVVEASNRLETLQAEAETEQARLRAVRLVSSAERLALTSQKDAETMTLLALRALDELYLPEADDLLLRASDNLALLWTLDSQQPLATTVRGDRLLLLTTDEAGTLYLWDAAEEKVLRTFTGNNVPVTTAVFNSDGSLLVVGGGATTTPGVQLPFPSDLPTPTRQPVVDPAQFTVRIWQVDSGQVLHELRGHEAPIASVSFSADSHLVVTTSGRPQPDLRQQMFSGRFIDDYSVRVWDVATGAQLRQFEGYGDVSTALFSPDGSHVLIQSDGVDELRDVTTGATELSFPDYDTTLSGFSPDGRWVYGTVRTPAYAATLWNIDSGEVARIIEQDDEPDQIVFVDNTRAVVHRPSDPDLYLWDIATGELLQTFSGPSTGTKRFTLSPDGAMVLGTGLDGTVRIWEMASGRLALILGDAHVADGIAFSPDGSMVLTIIGTAGSGSDSGLIRVWDAHTGDLIRTLDGYYEDFHQRVITAQFTPDSSAILTTHVDNTVRLWDARPGDDRRAYASEDTYFGDALWSADSQRIINSLTLPTGESRWQVWDVSTGRVDELPLDEPLYNLVASADGSRFATNSLAEIVIFDAPDFTVKRRLNLRGVEHYGWQGVQGVALSPTGDRLIAFSYGAILIWDVETGDRLTTLELPYEQWSLSSVPMQIFFEANRTLAVTVNSSIDYGVIHVIDVGSGEVLHRLEVPGSISWLLLAPGGTLVGGDAMIHVWNIDSGTEIAVYNAQDISYAGGLAITHDGSRFVTHSQADDVYVWDTNSGTILRVIPRSTGFQWLAAATISPDGRFFAFSTPGRLRVIDLDYHESMAYACSHLYRDLTEDERSSYGILDGQPTCPETASGDL